MAWTRVIPVTVDPTKVNGGANLTNFTFPIVLTNAELKTVANGGLVTNASGFDIATFADSGALTMLKFQRVSYSATAGTVVLWVKLPTLSATVGSIVWVAYGNSSISTDQQDAANAWDANTKAAYLFGDGTTLSLADHSGNYTLTNTGAIAAAGLFGGAISTNGSSTYADRTASTPVAAYPLSIETMIKPGAAVASTQSVVGLNAAANSAIGMAMQVRATDAVRAQAGNSGTAPLTANGVLNTSAWHYLGGAWTSDTSRSLTVDGAAEITSAISGGTTATPDDISVGVATNNSTHGQFFNGLNNFVIISNVARSAAWRITRDAATRGFATFTTAGSAMAVNVSAANSNVTFVAANAGDSSWPLIIDARLNLGVASGAGATIDDAIGTYGGRTPGPQLTQATAGNRPALVGTQGSGTEYLSFTGASSHRLFSAASALFQLSPTTPLYVYAIYEATGTGPIGGLAADPTSSTTYPYALLQAAGSNHKGDFAPEGVTTGRVQPDSDVAFADGKTRLAGIGHDGTLGGNADVTWRYLFGGRQEEPFVGVTTATAGNLKAVLGGIGASFGTFKFYWLGVTTQAPSRSLWMNLISFAQTQFSAQMDATKRGFLGEAGDSLSLASHSTDPKTNVVGSGTKSILYVCANRVSGARGSLLTQGFDLAEMHKGNYGVSGRGLSEIVSTFAAEIAPNVDGTRTGPNVLIVRGIENFIQATNANLAAVRAKAIELKVLADAIGLKLLWETSIDRGSGANGTNANGTGFYTDNTWVTRSVNGDTAVSFNVDLRTDLATYGHYLHDIGANAAFAIAGGTSASRPCNNVSVYDDKVHLVDGGYSTYGISRKDFFDNNDAILWPRTMPVMLNLHRFRRAA